MSKITYSKKLQARAAMQVRELHAPHKATVVGFNQRGQGFFVTESELSWQQIPHREAFEFDHDLFDELTQIAKEHDEMHREFLRRWVDACAKLKKMQVPA